MPARRNLLGPLEGYHYFCLLCKKKYFKFRWQVVRHLQDMHSGVSYMCLICGQIYARRTIPHACNAKEKDFEYIHSESGIQGDAARKILEKFIKERLEKNWTYVSADEYQSYDSSPQYKVKSKINKIEKGREPHRNEKKESKKREASSFSPLPIGDDPLIEVAEAPMLEPPVPVLPTDPDFVHSLEELAARILPLETPSVPVPQTTQESTKTLENILENMEMQPSQQDPLCNNNTKKEPTLDKNDNVTIEQPTEKAEETTDERLRRENKTEEPDKQLTEDEEKRLRREKRKQRKAERKRLRELEDQMGDEESVSKKTKDENENQQNNDMENNFITENNTTDTIHEPDVSDSIIEPFMTVPDQVAEARDKLENDLRAKQSSRVTLDVGGRHFATSKETLLKDKNSIFSVLLEDNKRHYFIDRDGAHFRYILNFLREDCKMNKAILPRETRYLLELQNECIYYKLEGLLQIVNSRLQQYRNLGLAFEDQRIIWTQMRESID